MSSISIQGNPERNRYEVLDGATVIGHTEYVDDDQNLRIFHHTVVNDEYAGQGLGGKLAATALDDTVSAGLVIVPVCSYIKKYVEKHPAYGEHTKTPTPAIVEFLESALSRRSE